MNLTPGELYFIRETDLLTNEKTGYVKIGLVREGDGRNSHDRALEHQTGNPRKLSVHKIIETPAISSMENIVHNLHATHRISGEWFQFNEDELIKCIQSARTLAQEVKSNLKALEEAEKLKSVEANDMTISASDIALSWREKYFAAKQVFQECEILEAKFKNLVKQALADHEPLSHVAKIRDSSKRDVFNKKIFSEQLPELYSRYCSTSNKLSARFTWSSYKIDADALNITNANFFEFHKDFDAKLNLNQLPSSASIEHLHSFHLQLLGYKSKSEWDMEIAQANVQMICGENSEIAGICKWNRSIQTKIFFDEKRFAEENPDIYSKYIETIDGVSSLIVDPKHQYLQKES